jgi:hypothetical protein
MREGLETPFILCQRFVLRIEKPSLSKKVTMKMSELKKLDAVLRMSRFSTKRKGCDKKRLSKRACRGKVIV